MFVIAFFSNRHIPAGSCAAMLASIGIAAAGLRTAYARMPSAKEPGGMMPQSLPGVDIPQGGVDWILSLERRGAPDGPFDVAVLDLPMRSRSRMARSKSVDARVVADLPRRRGGLVGRGAASPWILECAALGSRTGTCGTGCPGAAEDATVPHLTPADVSSLLSGLPLPRARSATRSLARCLLRRLDPELRGRGIRAGELARPDAPGRRRGGSARSPTLGSGRPVARRPIAPLPPRRAGSHGRNR